MTQEIVTYIIVALAVIISIRKLAGRFVKKKVTETCSDESQLNNSGCGSCTAECELRHIANHKQR